MADPKTTLDDEWLEPDYGKMARLADGARVPLAIESLPTRFVRLEKEVARLRAAIQEIADLSPKPGGVGQIARDALRVNP